MLELQAADLYHEPPMQENEKLALRLAFPDALIPAGIVFTEPADQDAPDGFLVFALTQRGELFTISLRRNAFVQPEYLQASTALPSDWCRSSLPSFFNLKPPHRMLAVSETELWVSLGDGALARLQRDLNTPSRSHCATFLMRVD